MNRFPRYGPHFQYYNPYRKNNFYKYQQPAILETTINSKTDAQLSKYKTEKLKDTVWLDLLGIQLYFDDVLILSLLFFLYEEEVKDECLFLALVLLLMS